MYNSFQRSFAPFMRPCWPAKPNGSRTEGDNLLIKFFFTYIQRHPQTLITMSAATLRYVVTSLSVETPYVRHTSTINQMCLCTLVQNTGGWSDLPPYASVPLIPKRWLQFLIRWSSQLCRQRTLLHTLLDHWKTPVSGMSTCLSDCNEIYPQPRVVYIHSLPFTLPTLPRCLSHPVARPW
jgi:hypothetical protein